jgi:dienelactone hydrolase
MLYNPDLRANPGVLLVHGGAGLDAHAREQAARIAELGYAVFACDMYGEGIVGDRARVLAAIGELTGSRDRMCRRAGAGLDVLTAHPAVSGVRAAVGYCFGGTAVLTLARAGVDLPGVVSVHGGLRTTEPATAGSVRARVLVSHGGADPHVPPSDVVAFTAEILAAQADWQLLVHAGAQHGFTHRHAVPGDVAGVAFDPTADSRTFDALRVFLGELGHLEEPPRPGATMHND